MTNPISAVIIVKDGERHLARVLAAVAGCAEVLVLDSGSGDATEALARSAGARFERQPFLGFGPQKNKAVEMAAHDWILSVDADEILDDGARLALPTLDLSDPQRAWRIRRRTFVGLRELKHGHLNDAPVRIFNRTVTRFNDVPVHESVTARGPVEVLPGGLLHYSFRDAAELVARGAGYTRTKAVEYRARGRRASAPWLLARAGGAFFKSYVMKRGILDGRLGVVVALSAALSASTALAMASERELEDR